MAIIWGAYSVHAGFYCETSFPYMSETSSFWGGFLYPADPMRIQMNTFYHLSYLLGDALGVRGSYVPYQVVYAVLWWARGLLMFLIVRKLLPECRTLAYCVGALTIIHSCDGAILWVGQLNQFGYIFWLLLAAYCFIRAWDAKDRRKALVLTVLTVALLYMSMWSYESQLVLVFAFPLMVMLARREWRKPWRLAAWYSVPVAYVVCTYISYARAAGHTYQQSVMRKSWAIGGVAGDWAFNIASSLKFWTWAAGDWKYPARDAYLLSAFAALVFAAGWIAIMRLNDESVGVTGTIRSCWILIGAGFVTLALSFPVFLSLGAARTLWRTQILSGLGTAMVFAGILGLVASLPLRRIASVGLAAAIGAVFVYYGSFSALQKGGLHRWLWERQRTAMLQILKVVPDIQPYSVVVLTNVPKIGDPFEDSMWFDLAIRLAYPGIEVAGVYFYSDGTPGPSNNMRIEGKNWNWDGPGFGHEFANTGVARTVVVEFNPSGSGKLVEKLPPYVCKTTCAADMYDPSQALITGVPNPIAARRYRVPE